MFLAASLHVLAQVIPAEVQRKQQECVADAARRRRRFPNCASIPTAGDDSTEINDSYAGLRAKLNAGGARFVLKLPR